MGLNQQFGATGRNGQIYARTNGSAYGVEISASELDIDQTLMSGQTFRWRRDRDGWWIGVIAPNGTSLRIKRDGERVEWEVLDGDPNAFSDYFRLDVSLSSLRDNWSNQGKSEIATAIDKMPGLRIVRQDPVECLFSFLCSSAAPIHRIRRSVDGLCTLLGRDLGRWQDVELKSFPNLESLATVDRSDLDRLGIGFRGRYIHASAREVIHRGGRDWLVGLRQQSYADAKAALVNLTGVGEKVADCVCLFSLDKDEAVPIDVHMARVARREFSECASVGAVTAKSYAAASESFRLRYGAYSGWSQQYFFFGEIARRGLWDQNVERHLPRQIGTGTEAHTTGK